MAASTPSCGGVGRPGRKSAWKPPTAGRRWSTWLVERAGTHLASGPVVLVAARAGDPGDRLIVFHPRDLDDGGPIAWAAIALLGARRPRRRTSPVDLDIIDRQRRSPSPGARRCYRRSRRRDRRGARPPRCRGRPRTGGGPSPWRAGPPGGPSTRHPVRARQGPATNSSASPSAASSRSSTAFADHHTAVDGVRLLALEAAWALDAGDQRAPARAALAFAGEQAEAHFDEVARTTACSMAFAGRVHPRPLRSGAGGERVARPVDLLGRSPPAAGRTSRAPTAGWPADGGIDLSLGPGQHRVPGRSGSSSSSTPSRPRSSSGPMPPLRTITDWGCTGPWPSGLPRRRLVSAMAARAARRHRPPAGASRLRCPGRRQGHRADGRRHRCAASATRRARSYPALPATPCLGYSEPDAGSDVAAP